jgi:hypothetical protein
MKVHNISNIYNNICNTNHNNNNSKHNQVYMLLDGKWREWEHKVL